MEQANAAAAADAGEFFYGSNSSPLGKARRWLWLSGLIGLLATVATARGSLQATLISGGFVLAIFAVIDGYLRHQLRAGRVAATLTDEGIESPVFSGDEKRFRWADIAGASVENIQGHPQLQLLLAESTGVADRRDFLTGRNRARPTLLLNRFSAEEQGRLIAAVERRLRQQRPEAATAVAGVSNAIAEEAAFQERLKQLAPTPWVLCFVVAANVIVWLATAIYGGSVLQTSADKLLLWGGNAASEVQHGEWWRLLTATFLHGGVMHLAMNMIGLVSAGITVERIYGHRLFLLVYLGSGLLGSALSLHYSAQVAVSVGASGAVFGVTGALLVAVFQHRHVLPKTFGKQTISSLAVFIVYALMQGFAKQGIDNAAHIGGLLGGCVLAFLLPERFDPAHFARHFKVRAVAGLALVLAATTGLAAMAPRAAVDQKRLFESSALIARGMAGFDAAIKAVQQDAQAVQSGRMSERQADERSRAVHAPAFRAVLQDLSAAYLRPDDPREALVRDVRRMSELLLESLAMESVYRAGSDKPEPADPQRMTAIETELREIDARLQKLIAASQAQQKKRTP